jgi:hypothetical protein
VVDVITSISHGSSNRREEVKGKREHCTGHLLGALSNIKGNALPWDFSSIALTGICMGVASGDKGFNVIK